MSPPLVTPTFTGGRPSRNIFSKRPFFFWLFATSVWLTGAWKSTIGPGAPKPVDVVGPVCESGDFLGHDRALCIHENDLLAVCSAGAYGMSMSSNYNTRPRAAEIMVDGANAYLVRAREEVPGHDHPPDGEAAELVRSAGAGLKR